MNHIIIDRQRGVGLIEVLVTVLLLATALLSLSALQIRSLQFNQSAYFRSQANILAYDIIDRMRLNRRNVSQYSLTYAASIPATGTALAQVDLREWRAALQTIMPNGEGQVECNGAGICTVFIRWTEHNQSSNDDENQASFQYTTRL